MLIYKQEKVVRPIRHKIYVIGVLYVIDGFYFTQFRVHLYFNKNNTDKIQQIIILTL